MAESASVGGWGWGGGGARNAGCLHFLKTLSLKFVMGLWSSSCDPHYTLIKIFFDDSRCDISQLIISTCRFPKLWPFRICLSPFPCFLYVYRLKLSSCQFPLMEGVIGRLLLSLLLSLSCTYRISFAFLENPCIFFSLSAFYRLQEKSTSVGEISVLSDFLLHLDQHSLLMETSKWK